MKDLSKMQSTLESRVREEPLGAVVISVIAGCLIASFFRLVLTTVVVGVGAYLIFEFLKDDD